MTLLATIGFFFFPVGQLGAHEIPQSVQLRIFVKPEANRIRVLARAPLEAMRDIDFPLRPGTGYLDRAATESLLVQAAETWILRGVHVREDGSETQGIIRRTRLGLASDRAFGSYTDASRHFSDAPLDARYELPVAGTMLDVEMEYPVGSPTAQFSIEPQLARLGVRTSTVMTFVSADGVERVLQYTADPGEIRIDPRWYHASVQFARLGIAHIWAGIDHLLFIICLVLPFRRVRPLIGIVTAFTVAHSITLAAFTLGWAPDALWFPPLIEVLIAFSIAYMAIENIVLASRAEGARVERRWIMAFAFGLIHGFGFAFALRESLQLAGSHFALSLVAFNVGVEIGQIVVLLAAVPLLALLYRHVVPERLATIIISAFVTHTAWHWLTDRWSLLRRYSIDWSSAGLPLLRLLFALAIAVGLAMILGRVLRMRASRIPSDAV